MAGFSKLGKDGGNTFHSLFSALNCFLLIGKEYFVKMQFCKNVNDYISYGLQLALPPLPPPPWDTR